MTRLILFVFIIAMFPLQAEATCWFPELGCPSHYHARYAKHHHHHHVHIKHKDKVVIINKTIVVVPKTSVRKEEVQKPIDKQKPIKIDPIK